MDDDGPLASLLASRAAFACSSEASSLVDITERHLHSGQVDWLEVGAGDGRNLQFQIDCLRSGRALSVTALEPGPAPTVRPDAVEWIRCRSEDYRPDRTFDWISVRHSAYYFENPVAEIKRLADALSRGGIIALTHWSERCILHRLHVALCGEVEGPACKGLELFADDLSGVEQLHLSFHETNLNVSLVLADPPLARALFFLACRGRPPLPDAAAEPEAAVARYLGELTEAGIRRNGILLLGRAD